MTRDARILQAISQYLAERYAKLASETVHGLSARQYQKHVAALHELDATMKEIENIKQDVTNETRHQ